MSLFSLLWGSKLQGLLSFWKVILAEEISMPLQDEHLLAAHPEEWPPSKIRIILVDIFLFFPSTFFPSHWPHVAHL